MAQKPTSDLSLFKHVNDDNADCDLQCAMSAIAPFPLRFQPTVLWSHYREREKNGYYDIIKSKRKYLTEINGLKAQYEKNLAAHNTILASDQLFKIQALWKKDPDPYFNSDYNWYFTGGTLSVHNTPFGDTIVFYPIPKCGFKVTRFDKGRQLMASRKFTAVNSIFQTECVYNSHYKLAMRHKDSCAVYILSMDAFNYQEYDISEKKYVAKLNSYPLSGMCINKYNLILADVKRWLAVYDQADGEVAIIKKYDTTGEDGNHFTQLESLTENTFAQLTSTRLNLWDIRQMKAVKILEKKNHPFGCMNNHNYGRDQSLIYVTTTKEIQTIDIRMNRIMNKVPHMISDTPFMSAFAGGATEYVAFSSHDPQEKVILGKSGDTYYTPLQIGDGSEFLHKQTLQNPAKTNYLKLKRKLLDNVTGIGMSMHDVVNMYTVNTLGDLTVYSSNVKIPSSSAEEEEGDQAVHDKQPTIRSSLSEEFVITSTEEDEEDPVPLVIHDKLAKRYSEFETNSGQEISCLKRRNNRLIESLKSKAKHLRLSLKRDFNQAWEAETLPGVVDTGEVNTREKINDWFRKMDVDEPE